MEEVDLFPVYHNLAAWKIYMGFGVSQKTL